jgi:hypothetical protein
MLPAFDSVWLSRQTVHMRYFVESYLSISLAQHEHRKIAHTAAGYYGRHSLLCECNMAAQSAALLLQCRVDRLLHYKYCSVACLDFAAVRVRVN